MFKTLFFWWLALVAIGLIGALALTGLAGIGRLLDKFDRPIFLPRELSPKTDLMLLIGTVLALTIALPAVARFIGR